MERLLLECSVKPYILKKMILISSIVLIIPFLVFLYLNFYVSLALSLAYIFVLFVVRNVDRFLLTDDGVYVCKKNGRVIYGYKYYEIDSVAMVCAGNYVGVVINSEKFKDSHWLVVRDKTKITVPEYVNNFWQFLEIIDLKINDKLSNELKKYINSGAK